MSLIRIFITNDAFYMKTDTSDNACGSTQMLSTGAYETSTRPEILRSMAHTWKRYMLRIQ